MRILILLLLVPIFSIAQEDDKLPKLVNDTLWTSSGYKVVEKEKIKIGTGSMPDGDFKFIRIAATSLLQYQSNRGYNGLANQANAFPRNQANLEFKVVRIDRRGNKKRGFVYYPIINLGMTRYEIDIENAINAGEIIVPDEFKPKKESTVVVVKQEVSTADEIAKLKKLFDEGTLTKEEFETAKKKLLEKQ